MNYTPNITDSAEEDILTTVNYITNDLKNPTAANNLLDEIERHEKNLEENPYIYPLVNDDYLSEKGLRLIVIKNYLMFFIIDEKNKTVTVLRFLYGRRNWKNLLHNIFQTDNIISKKNNNFTYNSQDQNFLETDEVREKALSDWTTGVNTALKKQAIKIAKSLHDEGMSYEFVQKHTGLDIETIKSLK